MFTAYFYESGMHVGSPVVVVAGFLRPYGFRMRDLARIWKEEWLTRKIAKEEVMATFRKSNPIEWMLTRQIEELAEELGGGS